MRLALAEVYETATFYAHFDVVKEGEPPIPPLTVRVCDSLTCMLLGAVELQAALGGDVPDDVRVVRAPCVGRCDAAPTVEVGHRFVDRATPETVRAAIAARNTEPEIPAYPDYDAYVRDGGYALLGKLRAGTLARDAVLDALDQGGLRGLGGAGFPAARKWRAVLAEPAPRLMASTATRASRGRSRTAGISISIRTASSKGR